MSGGFDQALLQELAVEMLEHVEACERVLVRAAADGVNDDDVHLLFRSVHSIKGLARVVAASGLEKLAHVAETLLASVREGKTDLDARAQELLLRAIDAFKQARNDLGAGVDFHADEALLVGLESAATRQKSADVGAVVEVAHDAASDLYFDGETLVALAEMFEETLPSLASRVASGAIDATIGEDVEMLVFAARKVGLVALANALPKLADRSDPVGYARALHLVDRLAQLLDRECGVTSAARSARAWLAPAVFSSIERGRWTDVGYLLRTLVSQSPFVGVVAQLACAEVGEETRTAARDLLLETLRVELAGATPSGADLGALAAERLRNMLLGPHQISAAAMRVVDGQRLDLDRFRSLPIPLVARVNALAQDPQPTFYEILVDQPAAKDALVELSRRANRELQPILTEPVVDERARCLAFLVATHENEDTLRARAVELAGATSLRALRRLDRSTGGTHFGVRARVVADAPVAGLQVRVPVALLDQMFGRIGQFFGVTTRFNALVFDSDAQDILTELADYCVLHAPRLLPKVERLVHRQNDYATLEAEAHRLISVIHEMTLGLRVIPIDTLFSRLPRMARDLAQRQGKVVRFDARSNGIRVDNGMLELLADPLVHMVRNCIDHGIETADARERRGKARTATVFVRAEQRGNHVVIEVGDDGRGIDLERVLAKAIAKDLVDEAAAASLGEEQIARFIFSPGFSTADKVTETSGRGVGMDVALVNVTRLGGVIDIFTRAGQGTTFRIDIPLSKAIQSMLLAETGVQTVAFPDRMVTECVVARATDVQLVNGQRSLLHHGRFLPLFRLVDLMQLPAPPTPDGDLAIVVCETEGRRIGVEVRRIRRRTDLLIQETHPRLAKLPGIGGISTLGTDKIVIVVDPEGLFELARRHAVFGLRTHEARVAEGAF